MVKIISEQFLSQHPVSQKGGSGMQETGRDGRKRSGSQGRGRRGSTDDGKQSRIGSVSTDDGKQSRIGSVSTDDGKQSRIGSVSTDDGKQSRIGSVSTDDENKSWIGSVSTDDENKSWIEQNDTDDGKQSRMEPDSTDGGNRKAKAEADGKACPGSKKKRSQPGQSGRRKVHRQVKDRLFRFLFGKDKKALLQLYNALNGTDYQDASQLQVVTIESAVYITMKNDVAFVLSGTLNLYEHQSTYNPNMPVRFLVYLAEEYQRLLDQAQDSLYGSKQIMLPAPKCVVFYNGEGQASELQVLKLSDAFGGQGHLSDVELRVWMYNINFGYNQELMSKCRVLKEYAEFVDVCRRHRRSGIGLQEALDAAIDECIGRGVLKDFLSLYRSEVLGMLLEEFDAEKYERTIREEGREEAFDIINQLLNQGRIEEAGRAAKDKDYREKLYQEFDL